MILPHAARFYLHIKRSFPSLLALVEEAPELQKIVHPKRGSASGDAIESILRHDVRYVGQQGFKLPARVVVEDPILTPAQFPRHQLVLGATVWMEGMGYAESARGGSHTTCIR